MKVVGIDPSLRATGITDAAGQSHIIRTAADQGDGALAHIYRSVQGYAEGAGYAVLEGPLFSTFVAGQLGMAHGAVRLALLHAGIPYGIVQPSTLKKYATGSGSASKADMRMALYKRTGIDLADDNAVDSWWLRQAALVQLGASELALPAAQIAALSRATWTDLPPAPAL